MRASGTLPTHSKDLVAQPRLTISLGGLEKER